MRAVILLAAVAVTGAFFVDHNTKVEFSAFTKHHEKDYETTEEYARREIIFAQNKAKRDAHNIRHTNGEVGWHEGVTQFSDMTVEEAIQSLGYNALINGSAGAIPASEAFAGFHSKRFLPRDWRSNGKVGHVKNQANCGSCWAFATTSVVESCIAIEKNIPPPDLSDQQLQDCLFDKKCSPGGGGGAVGIDWVKDNGIAYTNDNYPYLKGDGQCRFTNKRAHVSARIHGDNEDQLMNMLNRGPVLIGLNANPLLGYRGGVINDAGLDRGRNHAVTVIGVTNNCDGKSNECWIIKNQWGEGWGEGGYCRVAKGQRVIGLGDDSDMPTGCSGDGQAPPPPPHNNNNCPPPLKSCGDACFPENLYCCKNGALTQKQFC